MVSFRAAALAGAGLMPWVANGQLCGCEVLAESFCNFDYGDTGFCENCANFGAEGDCYLNGLPDAGADSCADWCFGLIPVCGCEEVGESFCNFDDGDTGFCESCSNVEAESDCYFLGLPNAGADSCTQWCIFEEGEQEEDCREIVVTNSPSHAGTYVPDGRLCNGRTAWYNSAKSRWFSWTNQFGWCWTLSSTFCDSAFSWGCQDVASPDLVTGGWPNQGSMALTCVADSDECGDIICDECPDGFVSDPSGGCCACKEAVQIDCDPVSVFGVSIFAVDGFGEDKVEHVANVLAKYLDNDEDGCVDDELVHASMIQHNAAMIMGLTEDDTYDYFYELAEGGCISEDDGLQSLFEYETRPECSGTGMTLSCRDAALEEVLHLISNYGYEAVYPDLYGSGGGASLSQSMDLARGGYFEAVPSTYPENAIYFYDDSSCDYPCQLTEYFYWALTSSLGAQYERDEGVCWSDDEWLACTPEKMQTLDPTAWDLLYAAPQTALPSVIPDGSYSGNYDCDEACCCIPCEGRDFGRNLLFGDLPCC